MTHRGLACLVLGWLSLVTACESDVAAQVRKHTYPPTFQYFTDTELKTTMWQLADLVAQIDGLLAGPALGSSAEATPPTEAERQEIDRLLGEMTRVSRALGPGGWPSNHPVVSRGVERFRLDLAAARRAVQLDPPVYYLAGSVAGSCLHCHGRD